ncbi:MAG: hypothetical protein EOM20_14035 [Spartobacteria bacterium]|nr:hypothetical protein [Spartobacteria bacterium]
MTSSARILILTLYCGENEFRLHRESIENQTHKNVEQVVFENLPNVEAHRTLYRKIMSEADNYDLFIKLDADMVLSRPEALAEISAIFASTPGLDHAIFAVHDFLPDMLAMGMHVFTGRACWVLADREENLFVDPNPVIPGLKQDFWNTPRPLALHACDPLPYQAFHFGLHRGLKTFQWGRKAHPRTITTMPILESTWAHFERTGDLRPGLAIVGAEFARRRRAGAEAANRHSPEAKVLFETVRDMSAEDIKAFAGPFWGRKLVRRLYWTLLVFPRTVPGGLVRRTRRLFGLQPSRL